MDNRNSDLAAQFVISAGTVRMPIGAFLLVRKIGAIGAIRITNIDPAATEHFGKSTYESYFQTNGSGSLVTGNVVRQTGELNLKDLRGPGRGIYIYRPAGYKARIGKWIFGFGDPTMMDMSDASFWAGLGDHGYEFAPTSACDVSEIDAHDNRLRWFRYDPNASVILPLAKLPK
jgi:hypothetical protein